MARKINAVKVLKSGSLSDIFKKSGKYIFAYTVPVKDMFQRSNKWYTESL